MTRAGRIAATIAVAIAAVLLLLRDPPRPMQNTSAPEAASADISRVAFDRWLARDPALARDFGAFSAFVARAGHADTVPSWTLLRASNRQCGVDAFVMPPRRLWHSIIPALNLVRDKVIPTVGRVEVVSAFRTPAVNGCARGASQSRHLSFSAVDLVPLDQPDAASSFRRLCARWRAEGRAVRWGLGAYFDAARPEQNQIGRFHVDATGWRSWGFSYGSESSGCTQL